MPATIAPISCSPTHRPRLSQREQLRFTVPGTWTPPQRDATGEPGYTYLEEIGGAIVSNETYDTTTQSVVADISLTLEDEIKIHYGWYDTENGGAEAPSEVPTGGYSQFAIAVKGTLDDDDDATLKTSTAKTSW